MRALLLKLEPIIWALFGGGMFVGALLLPAFLLVFGLLAPLGVVTLDPGALRMLFGHPLARAVVFVAVALPLWAGAHQLRHIVLDFGGLRHDGWVGALLYALALAGSVLAGEAMWSFAPCCPV